VDSTSAPPAPPGASPGADEALDQLLRQIVEGFFVLTDGQGALSKWSEPAELLFGLDADEALMEPFFGKLIGTQGLSADAAGWKAFLETGETPGATGQVRVDAAKPGGGTFAMEAVFVPVKLDEGFDFSLFLEDLGFELPIDMMLMRMRQQHPVVVRALRAALEPGTAPWDGVRTAGTLVAFRALEATPWMDEAMARREALQAEAEAEMQSRIEALEAPSVTGTDVYDLDDARAVIDRLRWATERIEDLEARSRVADDAVAQANDARVRAEAAEKAALDAKAEISGVLADRPVDSAGEADRLELLARVERIERAAQEAAEAAGASRSALEAERSRSLELEGQRAELMARLEQVETVAGSTSVAEAAVADARAELTARMEAIEKASGGGAAASAELVARLEALERARVAEAEELREEIERVRERSDVRSDLAAVQAQLAETARLREEIETLRERADAQSAVMRRGGERETAALRDAESARAELGAALARVEQLSEETARIKAHLESQPDEVGLSAEDRHKLETAAAAIAETRSGLEAIRFLAEELRQQSADLREEGGQFQARLNELADADAEARAELRKEQEELRSHLEELRAEREQIHVQLREAADAAEEARTLAQRGPAEGDGPAPATADEVIAARKRLDALAEQIEAAETRTEAMGAELSAEVEQIAETVAEARKLAREAGDRVDMVDRANQTALAQVSTQTAIIEEIGALARSAQVDAGESRADAGEARDAVARLEQTVTAAREQVETAVAEAAGAREQAAAAGEVAAGVRELAAGVGEAAREAVGPVAEELAGVHSQLDDVLAEIAVLRDRPSGTDPEVEKALEQMRADVRSLRAAMESAEGGDAAAVQALSARIDAVEEASDAVPKGLDARMESLREGLATALGKLETVTVELSATKTETGAGRQAVEQRLADAAAEVMAARTEAEQARRGLEGLQEEMASLREYAATAKAEAAAAREAVASARKSGAGDDRQVAELRTEIATALNTVQEARQAAVSARREAEQARAAAERAGAVNEATGEKFTEVWQKLLTSQPQGQTPRRPGSGVTPLGIGRGAVSRPKAAPPAREPITGFDDDERPLARLDEKGKFNMLNPAFCKLVGYQEHEFGKAAWPSVLDRQAYKEQTAELKAMWAGEQEKAVVDSTFMHGQGLMVLIKGEVHAVKGDDGDVEHLLLVAEPGGPSSD
jgi:hypothetical protein